jgi:nucleotide-binding universal stress UspA family protein
MIALKRILVPHDYSETSAASVTYAADLARRFGAALYFLHVGEAQRVNDYLESELGLDGVAAESVREQVLHAVRPGDLFAPDAQFFERAGNAATEIVKFSAEHTIDLIVMGTHGRGLVGHVVLGSVAEKVVRTAPCPVLTVRHLEAPLGALVIADEATEAARAAI